MNKSFIKFEFASRKYLIIFLFIVQSLTCLVSFSLTDYGILSKGALSYGLSFAVLMIATITLTPVFFSFLHNKKSIDAYYSLPLSRKSLLFNTIIFLICILYSSWMVPNTVTFILVSLEFTDLLAALLGFFLYSLVGLLIVFGLVFFYATIFLVANNLLDGIVMTAAYIFLPLFMLFAVSIFQEKFICGYQPFNLNVFGYLSMPFMACNMFFESITFIFSYNFSCFLDIEYLDMFIFFIETIIFGGLLYYTFINRKAENVEQNSDSFFAYPSMIYIYTFILLFILTSTMTFNAKYLPSLTDIFSNSIVYLFVFIFFMVAHFVYRRKIYINIRMIAFFVLSIVLVSGFSNLAHQTKGFGLSQNYRRDHENLSITINTNSYALEDDKLVERLRNELMDRYKDNYSNDYDFEYYGISFEINMNKEDIENNPQLYNYIDEWRNLMIEHYYDGLSNRCSLNCSWGNLNIFDKDSENKTTDYYYYHTSNFYISKEFSDELLKYEGIEVVLDGYVIPITLEVTEQGYN